MIDMLALQAEKAKKFSGNYQTELTLTDLANMCGIPLKLHSMTFVQFENEKSARLTGDKIYVPDCVELLKQAAFYRKVSTAGEKNSYL